MKILPIIAEVIATINVITWYFTKDIEFAIWGILMLLLALILKDDHESK